ncbi:armadillo-type protein [Cunninghamella echinulata]|nr:armadillo-type protein [Cunninghamella echinulata]
MTSSLSLQQQIDNVVSVTNIDDIINNSISINQLFIQIQEAEEDVWPLACQLAKYVGDSARNVSVRAPFGNEGIIDSVANLMKRTPHSILFDLQALRILGNLSIDNDENRQRVLDTNIIELILGLFQNNDPHLNLMLCGFCLNSSMDFEPVQLEIIKLNGVNILCQFLKAETTDHTVNLAVKALDSLVGQETGRQQFTSTPEHIKNSVTLFINTWKRGQLEDLDTIGCVADILLQVLLDDDNAQQMVATSGNLDQLMLLLDDNAMFTDDDMDDDEMEKLQEIKRTISKVIVYATSSDDLIDPLYNDKAFLSRLFEMAKSKTEVIHQTAIYIIGNLARTDKHCIDLVKDHHLELLLLELFKVTENAVFQSAILGCLKHISLPVENKDIIGNTGIIELISPLLDTSKDMLKRNQYLVIVILKILCTNNINNSKRLLANENNNESILNAILSFLHRVDDVAAKSEATRVLIQLIKSVWSQPIELELRQQLVQPSIVQAIIELIRTSTFPVLKNEGIIGLTVIMADHNSDISKELLAGVVPLLIADPPEVDIQNKENDPAEIEKRSFLEVVIDDISKSDLPIEIKCNTCILLETAINLSIAVHNYSVYESLHQHAVPLSAIAEPTLNPFIKKISVALEHTAKST